MKTEIKEIIQYCEKTDLSVIAETAHQSFAVAKNIIDLQQALDYQTTQSGQCLFMYKDPNLLLKMIIAVLAQFNASLNVTTDRMSAIDLYEAAKMFTSYTHDRIEDIILCLKKAKAAEYGKIYNRIDLPVIMEWWRKYLDDKALALEHIYRSQKGTDCRTETDTILIQQQRRLETDRQRIERIDAAARAAARAEKAKFEIER